MNTTQDDLERLIADAEEESLTLDYKAAAALAKTDGKKTEITKDVSAMANAAGGRIIYGIREFDDAASRHRPAALDPVDRRQISKEWLDQVIGSIRPRIDSVVIVPVQLSSAPDDVAYVVDVPQSSTAHQAGDKRYYRRYNFESVAMYDHEIRDVMARSQHPRVSVTLRIVVETLEHRSPFGLPVGFQGESPRRETTYTVELWARNEGQRFAQYVNGYFSVPLRLVAKQDAERGTRLVVGGQKLRKFYFDNTQRDVIGVEGGPLPWVNYGPSWFSPLLPGNNKRLVSVALSEREYLDCHGSEAFSWILHADNALPAEGSLFVDEVKRKDLR